jgi:hypothetical protein
MPAKIKEVVTKTLRLARMDEREQVPDEEQTYVTIRRATVKQNAERSDLFAEYIREMKDGNERTIFRLPLYHLMQEEVRLTLVDSNLLISEDKPLFTFKQSPTGPYLAMSKKEFSDAWGMLDDDDAAEIYEKVLEVNPHWVFGGNVDTNLGE